MTGSKSSQHQWNAASHGSANSETEPLLLFQVAMRDGRRSRNQPGASARRTTPKEIAPDLWRDIGLPLLSLVTLILMLTKAL